MCVDPYIDSRKEEGMEERECVDQWDVDEEEWVWEEVWREREWDEAWETGNITWHNDMVTTAEEYDRMQLTE
jgi:hypothetical protein